LGEARLSGRRFGGVFRSALALLSSACPRATSPAHDRSAIRSGCEDECFALIRPGTNVVSDSISVSVTVSSEEEVDVNARGREGSRELSRRLNGPPRGEVPCGFRGVVD
jgi:hypothetical protein